MNPKNRKIQIASFEDTTVVGINSSMVDYKLAWNINTKLSIDLVRYDDLIFEVCMRSRLEGYNEMPPPMLSPRDPREFLRAVVSVVMDIGMRSVRYKILDRAYSIAFPRATPINVNKKLKIDN